VWWGEISDLGRRPYLVMTRTAAVAVLHAVVVAPLTRTVRDIPTELPLGSADGLPSECAATFDGLRVVPKANLVERICVLDDMKMIEACTALRNAVAC
jgi:mRNA interferase MazF